MSALTDLVDSRRRADRHRPWPRVSVDGQTWQTAADHLVNGEWSLLGLWGAQKEVHLAVLCDDAIAVLTLDCPSGAFPSIGRKPPPALRFERTIRDLWGMTPQGLDDERPWLDHGRWNVRSPLGIGEDGPPAQSGYRFLLAEGESLHEIPVGPVHAGIIEPGHFRFTASGETVVRLEARLGYVHKGIER